MKFGEFDVQEFAIPGPLLITPKLHKDNRGFFTERYRDTDFQRMGLPLFPQENFSRSSSVVLRGLHCQHSPPQGKLVTVTRGTVFDVAVDVRRSSPTLGKHISVMLNGENPQWVWVPRGFAHGFMVLSAEGADLSYKVDTYYSPSGEVAVRWNDPELAIPWPLGDLDQERLNLSSRDQNALSFAEFCQSSVGDI